MRRQIPRHVIARNRATADADRNAQYYTKRAVSPAQAALCVRCGKPEAEHIFGDCDDLQGIYTPLKPAAGYEQVERAATLIRGAQEALGRTLLIGERTDLLLDNMAELPGVDEARRLVYLVGGKA